MNVLFQTYASPLVDDYSINWSDFLRQKRAEQASYIEPYSVAGWQGRVWLKRGRPKRSALIYAVLNGVATGIRLPWLKTSGSAAAGGRVSTAVELRRLQELRQAGVLVPQVLAHTEDAILMQDIGAPADSSVSLEHAINSHFTQGHLDAALAYWQQGLQALQRLHHKDQYVSQAFSRNMVLDASGTPGFVDFEDDPLEVMTLLNCKTRDLLCYLHSTAWPIAQAGAIPQAQAFLAQWVRGYAEVERQAFVQAAQRTRFARWFPQTRRFGKDAASIHYVHVLLSAVESDSLTP